MLHTTLKQLNDKKLHSYEADPGLLKEHFGIEETVLAGGYGYRQILELIQNGADALLEAQANGCVLDEGGRIHVKLRGSQLYVANTGAPLSRAGLDAILRSNSSPKRGNQIGRFGLGFKSLLKLNGRIDVFTQGSGAIRFDPERCRDELRRLFKVTQAPGLRLAWPLPPEERAADPVCAELAWAETIIRVEVRSESLLNHIREEIRSFPAEFLLFIPLSARLTLDVGQGNTREVHLTIEGGEHILHDGNGVSRWRIASREVHITDTRALADATNIHAREAVPVSWAMPIEGRREEAGRFWAFFPTQTQTYLPGILNAPWKLNSDRNAIIGGEWNAALMAEAASLITETLPSFSTQDDPGRPLDAFPRRLERKDEIAAPLIKSLWTRLSKAPVIPDGTGALRHAQELWRHPKDILTLAKAWQSLASPEQLRLLVHATCLRSQRSSRLKELSEHIEEPTTGQGNGALRYCSPECWFGLVASAQPKAARGVLQLAKSFSDDESQRDWEWVRDSLAIIPTQSGALATASKVVLAPEGSSVPGRASVATELQCDPETQAILRNVLGVREPDNEVWDSILAEALQVPKWPAEAKDAGWRAFWNRLRTAPAEVRKEFIAKRGKSILLCRRDGKWVKSDSLLFPGGLVIDNGTSENLGLLIDSAKHKVSQQALISLGVMDAPTGDIGPECFDVISGEADLLQPWLDACRKQYKETHRNSARPNLLQPDRFSMPCGYGLLQELTGVAKANFTLQLLEKLSEEAFKEKIVFGHSGRNSYPDIHVTHPLPWYLLSHGAVQLGSYTAPLKALVARRDQVNLRPLPQWRRIESALSYLDDAFPVATDDRVGYSEFWLALIEALASLESFDDSAMADLWSGAAKDSVVPSELRSLAGRVPLSAAFVTTSANLARRARTLERHVIALDPPTMFLWLKAGAQDLESVVKADWSDIAGPPEKLADVVPELGEVLRADVCESARCQRVTRLRLRIAETTKAVPCLMWEGALLIDAEQLSPLSGATPESAARRDFPIWLAR